MLAGLKRIISRIPTWSFWLIMGIIGLLIVIFNDAFGDSGVFGFFALIYFLLLIVICIRWFFSQIREVLRLKRDKTSMEMLHLKSQVNPHFFFNTLNNLYGLVEKDPSEAKALILKLSELMRYSIYEGQQEWVPLSQEITYLNNYVSLHRNRYFKGVDITFDVDLADEDYKIMPLMLILLVENAFKHGVEKLRSGAYVHLSLTAKEGRIEFDVTNNYDPEEVDNNKTGIGIVNLRRRLEIGYQKKYKLQLRKEVNTFSVKLLLLTV